MQRAENFVASRVFPIVPVAKKSDIYRVYNRDDWFREEAQVRGPGTESVGGGWELDNSNTYTARVFAIHKDISDMERSNADADINLDVDASKWIAQQLLMKLESDFVTSFITTSTWTGAATGADQTGVSGVPGANQFKQWNDVASNPIEVIDRLKDQVAQKTGLLPNTLVLGPQVFTELKNHPDILDRIKYTQKGITTQDLLAEMFQLDNVYVPYATRNTAVEAGSDSYSFYHGKTALLCYSAAAPSRLAASAGYTFGWTGYTGTGGVQGIGTGSRIKRIRMEALNSDRIEGEIAVDPVVVAADLGIFFVSAVA